MAKMKKSAARPKPHIRMRHMRTAPPSAFPAAPMAFPPGGVPQGPNPAAQAMAAPPEGMPTGAAPGDMTGG